jgi:hypothetical protein
MRLLIEPSEDEKRNGWTAETLTAYHTKREEETQKALDWQLRKPVRPRATNSGYRRFRR